MVSKILKCQHSKNCEVRFFLSENSLDKDIININITRTNLFGNIYYSELVHIKREDLIKELEKLKVKK